MILSAQLKKYARTIDTFLQKKIEELCNDYRSSSIKFWNIWKDSDENLAGNELPLKCGKTWQNLAKILFLAI